MKTLELYAVSVYDCDAEVLTLTKELAHSKLVAARVALANFCCDDLDRHQTFNDLVVAAREEGLEVDAVAFLDS